MKLFVVIFLALASMIIAEPYGDYSEEYSSQTNLYDIQGVWKDIFKPMNSKSHSQWKSVASSMPGARPFKAKVTQRIQNSNALRDMPHIQEKLYKIADEKLEKCISPVRQELDRRCVGRATGQIMQLVAAAENI